MRHAVVFMLMAASVSAEAFADAKYTSRGRRDPFTEGLEPVAAVPVRPAVSADMIGKSLVVEGISYSDKNPKAIVNGKILGVGDEVGKIGRISRIERDGIAIQAGGQEFFFKQTIGKQNDPK